MIFALAPCFSTRTVDDIPVLSALEIQYDIGLHVNACLGSFVLAFLNSNSNYAENQGKGMERLEEQEGGGAASPTSSTSAPVAFDFRNPGVTSMSIDMHKYGYASKGTSVVVHRTAKLRWAQYFTNTMWTGGTYVHAHTCDAAFQ
jgi:sphinganine-1-phosphate aldolase